MLLLGNRVTILLCMDGFFLLLLVAELLNFPLIVASSWFNFFLMFGLVLLNGALNFLLFFVSYLSIL